MGRGEPGLSGGTRSYSEPCAAARPLCSGVVQGNAAYITVTVSGAWRNTTRAQLASMRVGTPCNVGAPIGAVMTWPHLICALNPCQRHTILALSVGSTCWRLRPWATRAAWGGHLEAPGWSLLAFTPCCSSSAKSNCASGAHTSP